MRNLRRQSSPFGGWGGSCRVAKCVWTSPRAAQPQPTGKQSAISHQRSARNHSSSRRPLHPFRAGLSRCETQGNRLVSTNKQTPSPLFVPSGTADNSPPFQRWETPSCQAPAPSGATENAAHAPSDSRRSRGSVVPDGTGRFVGGAVPPLKRWAMIGCPCRDKSLDFPSEMTTSEALPLQGTEDFLDTENLRSVRRFPT